MSLYPLNPSGYTVNNPLPEGDDWRPLKKGLVGWDVFDLQAKLNYIHNGTPLALDGAFGPITKANVESYQAQTPGLITDGIAGAATQVSAGLTVCRRTRFPDRLKGTMQRETSYLCGIYTARYENGSQDTGPLQTNTRYHETLTQNFNVAVVIPIWEFRTKSYAERYIREGVEEKRAWAAGQGAWNSPVYADRYAHGSSVPPEFIQYITACTIYV